MKNTSARAGTALVATAVSLSAALALATPASAAPAAQCSSWQREEIDTIGASNLIVQVKLCVRRTASNAITAEAETRWTGGGGGFSTGLDKFSIQVRLERNDATVKSASANYTGHMNNYPESARKLITPSHYSSVPGGWTADGVVTYDIANDGAGEKTWQLGGSPSI
ncbi:MULTISPECIES: hypothetical protein [Streptomyces]|uniref:hypothetical protein n=1 Tax=Streptomyces TaxID=1883 RepID=UPI0007E1DF56|nr:hypothetical protein A4V12_11165 [Streptomyces noursei]